MMQITKVWIFFLGFVAHFHRIPVAKTQDIKIWTSDTNFLNPRNWEDELLPCENDRVIFPSDNPVVTFMPQSFAAGEMIFPVDGEIIFPDNAVLELTGGTRQGSCKGKDVHFKFTVDFWFEPKNWNITSSNAFPRIPNRRNAAVPHAFQVPCPTDTVRFPSEKSFRVHLDYPMTSVASLVVNDVVYSQVEFDELVRTGIGSLLFPDKPVIRITSTHCTDESGCVCGNDGHGVLPTICMFVTPFCPKLECSDPIQPIGNCCPICGASIIIEHEERFKLEQLLNLHDSFLSKAEFNGVESFTSKTHDARIQSVFLDGRRDRGLANRAAQLISSALRSDMKGSRLYKIRTIDLRKSEGWNDGVTTFDKQASKGMSSGGVAGLIISLLMCLGLGAAFYVYRKRHIPGFDFARFDLRGDKIELELGTTPHDELQPVDDSPGPGTSAAERSKGFDNPVYGAKVEEVSPAPEASSEVGDIVENPMFMIFEDSQSAKETK